MSDFKHLVEYYVSFNLGFYRLLVLIQRRIGKVFRCRWKTPWEVYFEKNSSFHGANHRNPTVYFEQSIGIVDTMWYLHFVHFFEIFLQSYFSFYFTFFFFNLISHFIFFCFLMFNSHLYLFFSSCFFDFCFFFGFCFIFFFSRFVFHIQFPCFLFIHSLIFCQKFGFSLRNELGCNKHPVELWI